MNNLLKKTYTITLLPLFLLLLFPSCTEAPTDVKAICELDDVHNYVIKWEVYPQIEGFVKIYSSSTPDHFDTESLPDCKVDIAAARTTIIATHGLGRRYFLLRFNDKTDLVLGTRAPRLGNVQNFRDLGGYQSRNGKTIRWGKIFRSGSLDSLDTPSQKLFRKFQIATLIDFRETGSFVAPPRQAGLKNVINLPINKPFRFIAKRKIKDNELMSGDARLLMQDINRSFVFDSSTTFRSMFNQLLVEDNYPVVLSDMYGKDAVGFATYLLLYALDIPEEEIMDDYLLTNRYLDKRVVPLDSFNAPPEIQEAVTILMSAEERFINSALDAIKKRYGTIDNYLNEELGVSPSVKRELQQILLTDNT